MDKLITLQKLKEEIKLASLDDLSYLLGRYCGPRNLLLRERKYDIDACKNIHRLILEEVAYREMDEILLSDQ